MKKVLFISWFGDEYYGMPNKIMITCDLFKEVEKILASGWNVMIKHYDDDFVVYYSKTGFYQR